MDSAPSNKAPEDVAQIRAALRAFFDIYMRPPASAHYSLLKTPRRWLKWRITQMAYHIGLYSPGFVNVNQLDALGAVLAHFPQFSRTHALMADTYSRDLFMNVLAARAGAWQAQLPVTPDAFNAHLSRIDETLCVQHDTARTPSFVLGDSLNKYDLAELGYPLQANLHPFNVASTFLMEQYAYRHGNVRISVEPGDTVIDMGGCWGDTALYSAHKAGPQGQVVVFEFLDENLHILRENLDLNDAVKHNVTIVEMAVWDRSGDHFEVDAMGPGTTLTDIDLVQPQSAPQRQQVETVRLDDYVQDRGVKSVDFIKMDIEGAELKALQGAAETIKRFRPKLAIAAYHKVDDLATLPAYILSLDPGYTFYLDHFTSGLEETVLFAKPA